MCLRSEEDSADATAAAALAAAAVVVAAALLLLEDDEKRSELHGGFESIRGALVNSLTYTHITGTLSVAHAKGRRQDRWAGAESSAPAPLITLPPTAIWNLEEDGAR